ncbi:hypothetical protein [Parvibaculum sp.]|uniref:hypothetical protein n=1 Tax=Parvibaculum sp. TaxID=2024848 RepID=UPI00391B07D9
MALVLMGAPRVIAHAYVLTFDDVRAALVSGAPVPEGRLDSAQVAYGHAIEWRSDDPSFRRDRALVVRRMLRLADVNAGETSASAEPRCNPACLKRAARDDLRVHAGLAPADGFGWALYADAGLEIDGDMSSALPALRLARLTAPRRASALLMQFRITMQRWDRVPEEMRDHSLRYVGAFWLNNDLRPFLIDVYLHSGYAARAAFREVMALNPRHLEQFDHMMLSGEPVPRRLR